MEFITENFLYTEDLVMVRPTVGVDDAGDGGGGALPVVEDDGDEEYEDQDDGDDEDDDDDEEEEVTWTMGIVEKSFQEENTESDDEEDEEDSDDEDEDGYASHAHRSRAKNLQSGEVVVFWDDGLKRVHKTHRLALVDRSFLHGDVVGRRGHYFPDACPGQRREQEGQRGDGDPTHQCGTVVGVDLVVDVKYMDTRRTSAEEGIREKEGATKILSGVHCKHLLHPCGFRSGNYVVSGKSLYRVEDIVCDITVRFKDGCTCEIKAADPDLLLDEWFDEACPFYTGMALEFYDTEKKRVLSNAKWIRGKYKRRAHIRGVLLDVNVSNVVGEYVTSMNHQEEDENNFTEDEEDIDPNTIRTLHAFSQYNWSAFDKCIASIDALESMSPELRSRPPQAQQHDLKQTVKNLAWKHRNWATVSKTSTRVSVKWQDGSVTHNLASTDLIPLNHVSESEYFPNDYVVRRKLKIEEDDDDDDDDTDMHDPEKLIKKFSIGIVQTSNRTEKTCVVKWVPVDPAEVEECSAGHVISEHSVYDLESHPLEFRLGDVVIRHAMEIDEERQWSMDKRIGELVEMKDDMLTVQWLDGTVSDARFNNLLSVENMDEELSDSNDHEEDPADDVQRQTTELLLDAYRRSRNGGNDENDMGEHGPTEEDEEVEVDGDDDNVSWETLPSDDGVNGDEDDGVSFVVDAFGNLLGQGQNDDLDDQEDEANEDDNGYYDDGLDEIDPEELTQQLQDREDRLNENEDGWIGYRRDYRPRDGYIPAKYEHINDMRHLPEQVRSVAPAAPAPSIVSEMISQQTQDDDYDPSVPPPQFEIVASLKDHRFRDAAQHKAPSQTFAKRVQKELRSLQNDLPQGIFVRADEQNMDLLRVVIIGPKETVYRNGLFVFDVFLPGSYPLVPPFVHFHSFGLRLHPNLYEDGKVCLSLLGTWTGNSEENWNPEQSNVLQVLMSLMGIIFGDTEPYFLEAGYESHRGTTEGTENSHAYNERTLLEVMTHTIFTIKSRLEHCRAIVHHHFGRNLSSMIQAMQYYLDQPEHVEQRFTLMPDGRCDENGLFRRPSRGFQRSLSRLLPRMVRLSDQFS